MDTTKDSRDFRAVMGRLPTGVTIVACGPAQAPSAMTANSVTSVSLEPPLLLVCVRNASRWLGCLQAQGHFSVNVLNAEQQRISQHYTGRPDTGCGARWDDAGQAPVLEGASAALVCEVSTLHSAGDHTIVIGRVTAMRQSDTPHNALVFLRGRYHELAGVAA